jgi:hypothetical protein
LKAEWDSARSGPPRAEVENVGSPSLYILLDPVGNPHGIGHGSHTAGQPGLGVVGNTGAGRIRTVRLALPASQHLARLFHGVEPFLALHVRTVLLHGEKLMHRVRRNKNRQTARGARAEASGRSTLQPKHRNTDSLPPLPSCSRSSCHSGVKLSLYPSIAPPRLATGLPARYFFMSN